MRIVAVYREKRNLSTKYLKTNTKFLPHTLEFFDNIRFVFTVIASTLPLKMYANSYVQTIYIIMVSRTYKFICVCIPNVACG